MQISSKIILPLPIYFNLKHKIILICGHNQCKILLIYFPIPQMYFNQIHISKHNNTKLLHNKIYSNNLNNNNRIYSNNHNRCKIPSHNHNNKWIYSNHNNNQIYLIINLETYSLNHNSQPIYFNSLSKQDILWWIIITICGCKDQWIQWWWQSIIHKCSNQPQFKWLKNQLRPFSIMQVWWPESIKGM